MSNPMYYNGDLIENGHAGPWDVPWGIACNADIRFFIFFCTGVMVSLRGRMGRWKQLGLAGCKARLSEAYWLAIAIGERPNYWDLLPDKFAAANYNVRGGCPTWLTHPGRVRPWCTLDYQPGLVGWTWVQFHDGSWNIAPPVGWVNPGYPQPLPPPPPADDGAALPTADDLQQPAALPTADDLQPTAALPTADEPTADDLQQPAADHEALPTAISLPQADVADAGAGPPSQLQQERVYGPQDYHAVGRILQEQQETLDEVESPRWRFQLDTQEVLDTISGAYDAVGGVGGYHVLRADDPVLLAATGQRSVRERVDEAQAAVEAVRDLSVAYHAEGDAATAAAAAATEAAGAALPTGDAAAGTVTAAEAAAAASAPQAAEASAALPTEQPEQLTLSHVAPPAEPDVDQEDEVAVGFDYHDLIVQEHQAERRASRAAMRDLHIAAELAATSSRRQPTEADSESETEQPPEAEPETRPDQPEAEPETKPVPEAETGAAMPTEPEAASAALPEEFFEPVAEPVAQPDLSVRARCDSCGTTLMIDSIRFAIPHQPINGKRPV
jgi:hypothetical protein